VIDQNKAKEFSSFEKKHEHTLLRLASLAKA
jgi:hypothetical protein